VFDPKLKQQLETHFASIDDAGRLAFVRYFLPQFLHEQDFLFGILSAWSQRRADAHNQSNAHSIEHKVMPAKSPIDLLPELLADLNLKLVVKE